MNVTIEWHRDQFNVAVSSALGKDPFVTIVGCRIVNGSKGEFISPPATKGKNDKWWNHARFSDEFQSVVLKLAKESRPMEEVPESYGGGIDPNDDIPFMPRHWLD